jgi:hypothetical protein
VVQKSLTWARVKGRVIELLVPRTPEWQPVWSAREELKVGPSVDLPALVASRMALDVLTVERGER